MPALGGLAPPRFDGTPEQLAHLERAFSRPVPPGGQTEIIDPEKEQRAVRERQPEQEAQSAIVPPAGGLAVAINDGADYGAAPERRPGQVNREQPGWRFVGRAKGLGDP